MAQKYAIKNVDFTRADGFPDTYFGDGRFDSLSDAMSRLQERAMALKTYEEGINIRSGQAKRGVSIELEDTCSIPNHCKIVRYSRPNEDGDRNVETLYSLSVELVDEVETA